MFDFSRMTSAFGRRASREERDIEDVSFEEILKDPTNGDAANEARECPRAHAVWSAAESFLKRVTPEDRSSFILSMAIVGSFSEGARWCDGLPASIAGSDSDFFVRLAAAIDSHLHEHLKGNDPVVSLFIGLCFKSGATWAREHPETPPV